MIRGILKRRHIYKIIIHSTCFNRSKVIQEWPYISPARSINVQFISGAFHKLRLRIFLPIPFTLFRNRGPPLLPFIRSCLLRRFVLRHRNTTLIMNHPTLSKLMPNHLTVRAKWRESFIFHISYKSKVRTFNQEVIGERGQQINIHQHSSKHTPILSHSMLIQRQRSTKTSYDGKYRP